MVHDRDVEAALELAQVREQRRDLTGQILVDAVQSDKGIEHEQLGAHSAMVSVSASRSRSSRRGDDVDVEFVEHATGGARDAGEPLPHDVERC